jgi:hypothetical protein
LTKPGPLGPGFFVGGLPIFFGGSGSGIRICRKVDGCLFGSSLESGVLPKNFGLGQDAQVTIREVRGGSGCFSRGGKSRGLERRSWVARR